MWEILVDVVGIFYTYLEVSSSHIRKNYPSVTLTRIFLDLWLGIFGLRSLAWDPGLRIFGLGSLAWELWLGIFGLGSFAGDLSLGGVRLGGLGPCIEESKQA